MFISSIPMTHPLFREGRWSDAAWLHRCTMRAFGPIAPEEGSGPRASAGILHRLEPRVDGGRVLVQSRVAPSLEGIRCTDISPVFSSLAPGDRVRFVLEFNAAKTVNSDGRRFRKALERSEIDPWVRGRLHGAVEVGSLEVVSFRQRKARGANLFVARVTGSGVVRDADALRRLAADGLGKGRSYGCGLLTVIPR